MGREILIFCSSITSRLDIWTIHSKTPYIYMNKSILEQNENDFKKTNKTEQYSKLFQHTIYQLTILYINFQGQKH